MTHPICSRESANTYLVAARRPAAFSWGSGTVLARPVLLAMAVFWAMPASAFEPPRPSRDRVLAALVKGLNEGSGKELRLVCAGAFREQFPSARLDGVLRGARAKYGKLADRPADGKADGKWTVYRPRGERQPFVLKLAFDNKGYLTSRSCQ